MKIALHSCLATLLVAAAPWAMPTQLLAAGGTSSGSGPTCTVTVYTTNEDGSTDNSVKPFQAACRSGQSNGDFEYYNPYTDTYETRSGLPRIEPLASQREPPSGSRAGAGATQGSSRSTTDSSSQSQTGSSGAPCTSAATSSKAIKKTRSTSSGRPCTSTPR